MVIIYSELIESVVAHFGVITTGWLSYYCRMVGQSELMGGWLF